MFKANPARQKKSSKGLTQRRAAKRQVRKLRQIEDAYYHRSCEKFDPNSASAYYYEDRWGRDEGEFLTADLIQATWSTEPDPVPLDPRITDLNTLKQKLVEFTVWHEAYNSYGPKGEANDHYPQEPWPRHPAIYAKFDDFFRDYVRTGRLQKHEWAQAREMYAKAKALKPQPPKRTTERELTQEFCRLEAAVDQAQARLRQEKVVAEMSQKVGLTSREKTRASAHEFADIFKIAGMKNPSSRTRNNGRLPLPPRMWEQLQKKTQEIADAQTLLRYGRPSPEVKLILAFTGKYAQLTNLVQSLRARGVKPLTKKAAEKGTNVKIEVDLEGWSFLEQLGLTAEQAKKKLPPRLRCVRIHFVGPIEVTTQIKRYENLIRDWSNPAWREDEDDEYPSPEERAEMVDYYKWCIKDVLSSNQERRGSYERYLPQIEVRPLETVYNYNSAVSDLLNRDERYALFANTVKHELLHFVQHIMTFLVGARAGYAPWTGTAKKEAVARSKGREFQISPVVSAEQRITRLKEMNAPSAIIECDKWVLRKHKKLWGSVADPALTQLHEHSLSWGARPIEYYPFLENKVSEIVWEVLQDIDRGFIAKVEAEERLRPTFKRAMDPSRSEVLRKWAQYDRKSFNRFAGDVWIAAQKDLRKALGVK